jgi:hypothetical protein
MKSLREIVLIAMLAAACTGCKTKEPIIEPFLPVPVGAYTENTEAQERQEQLEEIAAKHSISNIADIIYYDEAFKERYVQAMQTEYSARREVAEHFWETFSERPYASVTILPNNLVGKGKNSIMVVFPAALEKNSEDLLSFLVDHETVHAKDNKTGITLAGEKITPEIIKKMGTKNYENIMELRAYGNQLVQIEDRIRDVSAKTKDFVVKMYCLLHSKVMGHAVSNKYSMSAIKQAQYFPMMDLDTKKLVLYRVETPKGQ